MPADSAQTKSNIGQTERQKDKSLKTIPDETKKCFDQTERQKDKYSMMIPDETRKRFDQTERQKKTDYIHKYYPQPLQFTSDWG